MFSKVFVSLVRSGEQTGKLAEVLKSLTESLKWEDELAAQTKKLAMYPAFVGGIVLLVTFFLMIYLVPQMTGFIRNMGQDIPLQTRILMAVSSFFVDYWWAILAAPFVAWFGAQARDHAATRRVEYAVDHYKISMPLIGPILRKIILSRFASSFAMMYASGITVLDAIRSCEEIVGNRPLEHALRTRRPADRRGQEPDRGVPGPGAVPAAGDPHDAHRREPPASSTPRCSTSATSTTARCASRSARCRR